MSPTLAVSSLFEKLLRGAAFVNCASDFRKIYFPPKDIYLGELMSTVCGCTCEGGQVWVHARRRGVGDGPDPAGGRLGVDARRSVSHAE